MNDMLVQFGLPGLGVLALVLVGYADWERRALQRQGEVWRKYIRRLEDQSDRIERIKQKREKAAKAAAAAATSAAKEAQKNVPEKTEVAAAPVQQKLSPLQEKIRVLRSWAERLLHKLKVWSEAGGVPLEGITPAMGRLEAISAQLLHVNSPDEFAAIHKELWPAVSELMCAVVSKTDRDLDVKRSDAQLQAALTDAVSWIPMSLIDPTRGEPLNTSLHDSRGTEAGALNERGKVSTVLRRGLRSEAGDVIQRAEVLEFD